MKTLIAVAMLLALASPARAATAKPQDFSDIRAWKALDFRCDRGVFPEDDDIDIESTKEESEAAGRKARDKICSAAEVLGKKLIARGYCLYGKGDVGRAGRPWTQKEWERTGGQGPIWPKDRKHCYEIEFPEK